MGKGLQAAPLEAPAQTGDRRAGPEDLQIGQRIRQLRTSRGLSQDALASRLGVSCQQFQKYEAGTNRITASRLVRLADLLDVEVIKFLRDEDARTAEHGRPNCEEMLELMGAFAKIKNPTNRAKIVEMAAFLASLEPAQ